MSGTTPIMLQIRTEAFDHGVYPAASSHFNITNLTSIIKELHGASTIEYKITSQQWCEKVAKKMPSLSEKDAEIYFITFKTLFADLEVPPPKTIKSAISPKDHTDKVVDIRYFAVYMGMQLFCQSVKSSTEVRKNMSSTPWPSLATSPISQGMASPRSKATKVQYTLSEYQLLVQFIKLNLKHILNLISSEVQPLDSINLSASDLNALRVLFCPMKPDGSFLKQSNFAALTPFFSGSTSKVKLGAVSDWVISVLSTKDNNEEVVEMNSLCKAVSVYEQDIQNKDLKITNCEDCYLYINSSVNNVIIANCTNCTIMIAAVAKVFTIDKSERVNLSVAANAVRAGNSVDCKLALYAVVRPILYGDNRSLQLGPHNVAYDELMGHVKKARITVNTSNLQNWTNPYLLKSEKDSYSLQEVKDFTKLVLPSKFKENLHILAPANYLEVLNERNLSLSTLMTAIKGAKLTPEQQAQLHNAVQGHFREWVVSTNNIKAIEGLVKMIDESGFGKDI